MRTERGRQNSAGGVVTTRIEPRTHQHGYPTLSTKAVAGYGTGIGAQMATAAWGAAVKTHRRPTGLLMRRGWGRSLRECLSTINVEIERASIPPIYGRSRSLRIITWGKSCEGSSPGGASLTRNNETYRQPDLFVSRPEPKPTKADQPTLL